MDEFALEEEQRKKKAERIARMKEDKRRQELRRKNIKKYGIWAAGAAALCIAAIAVTAAVVSGSKGEGKSGTGNADAVVQQTVPQVKAEEESAGAENAGAENAGAESAGAENADAENAGAEPAALIRQGAEEKQKRQEFEMALSQMRYVLDEVESKAGSRKASEDAAHFFEGYQVNMEEGTGGFDADKMISSQAILVDMQTGNVVAQRDAMTRIYPASMTKILTLLVAAEHVLDLDDTVTITIDITDYTYRNDCSVVGFAENETVTVRDLLYGTILPSGADAALALAEYVAGSQEAFVDLMNQKLKQLGLAGSAHFTNCIGLYDENHYCTVADMAMILKAAEENELCHQVLEAHTYTTSATQEHPEGLILSNWFLRRIEDKDTHGEVLGAKTGFVDQSGSCAASYAVSNDGKYYICVTVNAYSAWRCIYDHVEIYQEYLS